MGRKKLKNIFFIALGTTNLNALSPWAFFNQYFVVERASLKNLSGCERLQTKEDSLAVFLLMARVSQLRSCRISVIMLAEGLLLPKQNRVAFLGFKYRSRASDLMRHLCIRGLVELRCYTPFLSPIWDRWQGWLSGESTCLPPI